jgi:5'-3' exonuclease
MSIQCPPTSNLGYKMKKRRILIDLPNICYIALFVFRKEMGDKETDFTYHKHLIMNILFKYIREFEPDEIILAIDDKKCWRHLKFPEYKAHRKLKKKADGYDWNTYYTYLDGFTEELKKLPFKILKVPYSEADDTVGVLSKTFVDTDNILISGDSDYIQLLKHKQNKLYSTKTNKFIKEDNPEKALMVKIISGDKTSDNIPPIKPRVGPKTAIKLLETDGLEALLNEDGVRENFELNKLLISLDEIPITIQTKILDMYDNYKVPERTDWMKWLKEHKLKKIFSQFSTVQKTLNNLNR